MSLATVETAVIEYVGDAIAECLGWSPEDAALLRVLRYHGARSVPPECCGEAVGSLVAVWEDVSVSSSSAGKQALRPGQTAFLVATLNVRYLTCWPTPEPTEMGPTLVDDEWDAAAALLADVGECMARALVCLAPGGPATAILAETGCNGLAFASVTPIEPNSGCAGVSARSVVTLLGAGIVP